MILIYLLQATSRRDTQTREVSLWVSASGTWVTNRKLLQPRLVENEGLKLFIDEFNSILILVNVKPSIWDYLLTALS